MKWWLLIGYWFAHSAVAAPHVVSLNVCYDAWLPQLLPAHWQVSPTTEHGNRLEALIALQPDYIVAGSFTDARLLQQLAELSPVHVIQQPNDYQQWRREVLRVGEFLQQPEQAEHWLAQQQQQLTALSAELSEVLIIMPNYYTWAQDSWAAQLLKRFSVRLISPYERGYLGQLRLEQLLSIEVERVVFEGFSQSYSRGQDWLYHGAVQRWLAERKVGSIAASVASCPAVNAVAYMQQLVAQREVTANAR